MSLPETTPADASGGQSQVEFKKERAVRLPSRWEQFRPAGPHGEDRLARRRQDNEEHGLTGVRRHALTIVFRAH